MGVSQSVTGGLVNGLDSCFPSPHPAAASTTTTTITTSANLDQSFNPHTQVYYSTLQTLSNTAQNVKAAMCRSCERLSVLHRLEHSFRLNCIIAARYGKSPYYIIVRPKLVDMYAHFCRYLDNAVPRFFLTKRQ